MRRGILIVSASMGAGHDGAAYELQRRLEAQGHDVRVVDYLKMIPWGFGSFMRWTYVFQLQRLPWTYDLTYAAFNRGTGGLIWAPIVRLASLVTRRPLRREFERTRPDVVVSTYPLASLVLGRMRKKKLLRVPVATYLCDFAVHPLWVHPNVDLHLAVSQVSADTAAKRGSHNNVASGPLVGAKFRTHRPDREDMRRSLGIEPHERAVLVVAGSWGVGDVPSTVEAITRCGSQYHAITVCGKDDKLRASLLERGLGGTVLGWTDQMPGLMSASDALVENAGGLSAMEAFAAGLPVISFLSIPGHGKDNAKYMSGSGVSRWAHDEAELASALVDATTPGPAREAMIEAGKGLFAGDPAVNVVELAANTPAHALLTPFRTPRGRRRLGFATVSLAALYFALTVGAQGVAALGVGVAKAPKGVTNTVYLGVRLDGQELHNGFVVGAIKEAHATLVIDGRTAQHAGSRLHTLVVDGVDIANGGWGKGRFLPWNRAHDDCDKSWKVIVARSGKPAHEFVPGRALNAFDQLYCRTGKDKQRLVRPNVKFQPENVPTPQDRKIYLLDGRGRDPVALALALADFESRVDAAGLHLQSLAVLR